MAPRLRVPAAGIVVFIAVAMTAAGRASSSTDSPPGGSGDQKALEFAQALQRRYDGIKDFSADFEHAYQGGVLRKRITERGHVIVKKPGKMRWDYTTPERKVFVSDGVKIYSYIPEDRQVIVATVPRDDHATVPTLFLAGKGNLARDFTPSLTAAPAGFPPEVTGLKLVPKTPEKEYDWLILIVEPARMALRGLVTGDAQGGTSSLSFVNLKENVGLADKDFEFKIPRNVDVVTDSSPR